MKREHKIAMLKAIATGKLLPTDVYVGHHLFIGKDGIYKDDDGMEYNEEHLQKFIEKIDLLNERRTACGVMQDLIAVIVLNE